MSGETIDQQLALIHEQIERGNTDEAVAMLKPILETDSDNADAWWLYAHAVDDSETARMALNNVLRIDSNYPGADVLLKTLEAQYPSAPSESQPAQPPSSLPGLPEDEDIAAMEVEGGFDDFIDNLDEEFALPDENDETLTDADVTTPQRRFPLVATVVIALLLIVVVILLLLFAPREAQSPVVTETSVVSVSPTVGAAAFTLSADNLNVVTEALQGYSLVEDNAVRVEDTSLGNTLIAGICSPTSSRDIADSVDGPIMDLAQASADLDVSGLDAIGIAATDCDSDTIMRVIAAPVNDVEAYADGTLEEAEFRAAWRAAS